MSLFVQAVPARRPKNRLIMSVSLVAAAMLTVVSVVQLFTFDDYPVVLAGYPLPGGYPTASLLAALLVTLEVFAVPYFLMMQLSPLMRLFSFVCGLVCCTVWFVLALYLITQGGDTMNGGLLGATLAVSNGWLPLLFSVVLVVLLAVSRPYSLRRVLLR